MKLPVSLRVTVIASLLFGGLGVADSSGRDVPASTVATVNGIPILERAVRGVVAGIAAVRPEIERSEQQGNWEQTALESLIEFELLYQEAKRQGVAVPPEEVDKEVERTKRKFGGEQAYMAALTERGWTLADVRADTERSLVVQRFLETVVWKQVHVSSEAVEEFYRRHRDQFRHPPQVWLRHVLVRPLGDSAEAWAQAEQQAWAVQSRWQQKNDVTNAEHHEIENLGWVGPGELAPAFEATVLSLEPGKVSAPLKGKEGFHVFQVTAHRPEGFLPLEEVRPKIEAVLRRYQRQKLRDELVARLRQTAKIRYHKATR